MRILLLAPCPYPTVLLIASSCCNPEATSRLSCPVRFKHEAEFVSLCRFPHAWTSTLPWHMRKLVKGKIWNMGAFYALFTLSLWLLVGTGSAFKISYCLQLPTFPVTAGWLILWARESCRKGRARRYKKMYLLQKKITSYSSSVKRFWKCKEKSIALSWIYITGFYDLCVISFPVVSN